MACGGGPPCRPSFAYDTQPPSPTTLITPTGSVVLTAPILTLQWVPPPPDGGAPLASVVMLDGKILITTTASVYTLTAIADGPHVWGVRVVDGAGNYSSWVTETFSVSLYQAFLPLALRGFEASPPPALANSGLRRMTSDLPEGLWS